VIAPRPQPYLPPAARGLSPASRPPVSAAPVTRAPAVNRAPNQRAPQGN
jgi:hypothetical protein